MWNTFQVMADFYGERGDYQMEHVLRTFVQSSDDNGYGNGDGYGDGYGDGCGRGNQVEVL